MNTVNARRRFAAALALSLAAHASVLCVDGAGRPLRPRPLTVSLSHAPAAPAITPLPPQLQVNEVTTPYGVASERAAKPVPSEPARRRLVRKAAPQTPDALRPPELSEHAAPRSGRELADAARADAGRVLREMTRQERTLDPSRGVVDAGGPHELPRSAVVAALERQFGRPLPFKEETNWVDAKGARTWRIATEVGAVCFQELPSTVVLTVPGQGARNTMLVPMYCK